jgi:hypothetical protein
VCVSREKASLSSGLQTTPGESVIFSGAPRGDCGFTPRAGYHRGSVVTATTKSTALACRYPPAAPKAGLLTINRIRDPPTARQLKRHADRSSTRSSSKRVSLRVQLGAIVSRPRRIARIPKLQLLRIGLPLQTSFLILELRFRGQSIPRSDVQSRAAIEAPVANATGSDGATIAERKLSELRTCQSMSAST